MPDEILCLLKSEGIRIDRSCDWRLAWCPVDGQACQTGSFEPFLCTGSGSHAAQSAIILPTD